MKRTPLIRRTPLKNRRGSPRRSEGRTEHHRIKPRAKSSPDATERQHHVRLRAQPCAVPGCNRESILHHVMHMAGKTRRRDHRFVVPLCPDHHNMGDASVHLLGSEAAFLRVHGVDLVALAMMEWEWTLNHIDAEDRSM